MVGSKFFNKFELSLKEDFVYIMYNFRFRINEIQDVMKTTHKYWSWNCALLFIFFTHPSVFLSNSYKYEVMVGEFQLSLLNFIKHNNMI